MVKVKGLLLRAKWALENPQVAIFYLFFILDAIGDLTDR